MMRLEETTVRGIHCTICENKKVCLHLVLRSYGAEILEQKYSAATGGMREHAKKKLDYTYIR